MSLYIQLLYIGLCIVKPKPNQMIVRHYYKNFVAVIQDNSILIYCTIGNTTYTRRYDVPKNSDHITCDNEYIRILFDDANDIMYQIKFEDGDCIVGDLFSSVGECEHLSSFMCHDFNDDVVDEPLGESCTNYMVGNCETVCDGCKKD